MSAPSHKGFFAEFRSVKRPANSHIGNTFPQSQHNCFQNDMHTGVST